MEWYAGDRATSPPELNLLRTEIRPVNIGLSDVVGQDETVSASGMITDLSYWDGLPLEVDPRVGPVAYNQASNVASQNIDGSLLPYRKPVVMRVAFTVITPTGNELRSVFVVLRTVV